MLKISEDSIHAFYFIDIISLDDTHICLKYKQYTVLIEANQLNILSYMEDELVMKGKCMKIQWTYHEI